MAMTEDELTPTVTPRTGQRMRDGARAVSANNEEVLVAMILLSALLLLIAIRNGFRPLLSS